MNMKYDAVILIYNPDGLLYKCIQRILKQTVLPDKLFLIVTESASFDSEKLKAELACRGLDSERIRTVAISPEEFNHGNTRRMAADMCESDYMLFMTQDAVPANKRLTEELLNSLQSVRSDSLYEDVRPAVAFARQLAGKNSDIIERFSRIYNYPASSAFRTPEDLKRLGIRAIFCSDTCAMYNMDIYRKLGGFERDVDFNEDELFAYKALTNGYGVFYCAEASVIHSHNYSLKQQFLRSMEIAKSQKKHSKVFKNLKTEKEGFIFLKNGASFIASNGTFFDLIYFIVYCGVRFIAFKAGSRRTD